MTQSRRCCGRRSSHHIVRAGRHVAKVPSSDFMQRSKQDLFDHPVGAGARGLIRATLLSEDPQSTASTFVPGRPGDTRRYC